MKQEDVHALIAKQAINETLVRYCRGMDRCDADTLKSAFWPEATDDHGTFNGRAAEFCDWVIPVLRDMRCTMHSISNVHIELAGNRARVETYCVAQHIVPGEDGEMDVVVGGRYLDQFEQRDGDWRILERVFVMDWNSNMPSTAEWEGGLYASLRKGDRHPHDAWDKFPPPM